MSKTKYTVDKEHDHLKRVVNPKNNAVHLVCENDDHTTVCGVHIKDSWNYLGKKKITCQGCLYGLINSEFEPGEFDILEEDYALEMADLIAGDESDGVYWGIAHEFGYFG